MIFENNLGPTPAVLQDCSPPPCVIEFRIIPNKITSAFYSITKPKAVAKFI